jgi:hypothetical protein
MTCHTLPKHSVGISWWQKKKYYKILLLIPITLISLTSCYLHRKTRGRNPLPAILHLNFFWSKIFLYKIKDSIPLDAGVNCRNQIFNFVEGQFLTKRNSSAKWREGSFVRVFYGSCILRIPT